MTVLEYTITYFLNSLSNPVVDFIATIVTSYAFLAILIGIVIFLVYKKAKAKGKNVLVGCILAFLVHYVITELIIKNIFSRSRPYEAFQEITPIGTHLSDSSFPSSHVAALTAIFFVICYYDRRFIPVAIIIIILTMFFRLYGGMHYISDVFAGLLFGLVYGIIAVRILDK